MQSQRLQKCLCGKGSAPLIKSIIELLKADSLLWMNHEAPVSLTGCSSTLLAILNFAYYEQLSTLQFQVNHIGALQSYRSDGSCSLIRCLYTQSGQTSDGLEVYIQGIKKFSRINIYCQPRIPMKIWDQGSMLFSL